MVNKAEQCGHILVSDIFMACLKGETKRGNASWKSKMNWDKELVRLIQATTLRCVSDGHMKSFWQNLNILLTNDLKDEWSPVLEVIHLHAHLIHSGVLSLRCTDEQDTVPLGAADVHPLRVQGLTVLCPADHRFGFALCLKKINK